MTANWAMGTSTLQFITDKTTQEVSRTSQVCACHLNTSKVAHFHKPYVQLQNFVTFTLK